MSPSEGHIAGNIWRTATMWTMNQLCGRQRRPDLRLRAVKMMENLSAARKFRIIMLKVSTERNSNNKLHCLKPNKSNPTIAIGVVREVFLPITRQISVHTPCASWDWHRVFMLCSISYSMSLILEHPTQIQNMWVNQSYICFSFSIQFFNLLEVMMANHQGLAVHTYCKINCRKCLHTDWNILIMWISYKGMLK